MLYTLKFRFHCDPFGQLRERIERTNSGIRFPFYNSILFRFRDIFLTNVAANNGTGDSRGDVIAFGISFFLLRHCR